MQPAAAGRKTGLIMTNTRKRHTPQPVVRKLGQADWILADGADIAAVCRELGVSEQTYCSPRRTTPWRCFDGHLRNCAAG